MGKMILKKVIISFLYRIKTKLFWRVDRVVCRVRSEHVDIPVLNTDCKILILAPHSDDEWIGCSQIIKNNNDAVICNMNMQGGDTKELHKIRYQEMESLAKRYNHKLVTVNSSHRASDLKNIINDVKPEMVFVPFFMDWHDEHIQVMNVLKEVCAAENDFQVGMYPVSLPMLPQFITHYNPLNKKSLREKWNVFKLTYKTQTCIPSKRFAANEEINGACVGEYAAEVYSIMPIDQWMGLLNKHMLSDDQKKNLKNNLNKISKVRALLRSFCNISA